jgi:hypothetical protein
MKDEQTEFKIGDRLVFAPYEREHGVIVREVFPNKHGDGRTFYKVNGMTALSVCAGNCLKESRFFDPMSDEEKLAWKNRER